MPTSAPLAMSARVLPAKAGVPLVSSVGGATLALVPGPGSGMLNPFSMVHLPWVQVSLMVPLSGSLMIRIVPSVRLGSVAIQGWP